MGQHPLYNGIIKRKGAIKMTHMELRMMLKQLSEYQLKQISQAAMRFLALNQELTEITLDTCPCCGDHNAVFIRKGIQSGKQRFQCKSCGRKFTYDSKQLTAHSHQPMEAWVVVLEDTLSLTSLDSTAKKIGVCHSTAFHMRHKLLVYMEELTEQSEPLEALIEADETYIRKVRLLRTGSLESMGKASEKEAYLMSRCAYVWLLTGITISLPAASIEENPVVRTC